MKRWILVISLTACSFVVGCRREVEAVGGTEAETEGAVTSEPELPAGWEVAPPGPVRKASFLIRGAGGTVADVSLTVRPGRAANLLETVNGWQSQLGVAAFDSNDLERETLRLATPAGEARVVDVLGFVLGAKSAYDGRVVVAIVERPRSTWWFKIRGNPALVEVQKQAFLDWVGSFRPEAFEVAEVPVLRTPQPSLRPAPGREPAWQLPDGWKSRPAGPDSYADFIIEVHPGRDAGASVALLAGDEEVLLRVNQCRAELGHPHILRRDLASLAETVWMADTELTMARLAGMDRTTHIAWAKRPEGTWFFRFTGPSDLVAAEGSHFARFLQSVRFAAD